MAQAPYIPMHPPKKHLTVDDMFQTLAKHCPVPEKPKPLPKKPLEWQKPVRTGERSGYMLSQCGRWSVSKDAVGDGVVYTAWRRSQSREVMDTLLGCSVKREEAERMCNEDSWRD